MLRMTFNTFTPRTLSSVSIHSSAAMNLKEITTHQDGKTITIEGKYVQSPRETYMLQPETHNSKACAVCRLPFEIKHTDVLILSQFVRSDGCMLPKRITGLCSKQQRRMSDMISMAHKAGLLSTFNPPNSKRDTTRRKDYKKFNTYFDESTIRA